MGATSKYGLPWPEGTANLRDGFAGIKLLAEKVEAALLPPLLATSGDGDLSWASGVAEVPWDVTDSPDRRRGTWDSSGNAERLVIPSLPGWYLVSATARFAAGGQVDGIEASIRTRAQGSEVGSGEVWATHRVANPGAATTAVLAVASLVRVADTNPRTGIAVRLAYTGTGWAGGVAPPGTGTGANRLRIMRMSAL